MDNFIPFLAFRHIRRRPLQSILTILGVAVGVMVLITVLSFFNGFIDELISSTLKATPHITLNSYTNRQIPYDEVVLRDLLEHPQVEAASPFLETQGLIARRANKELGISGRRSFVQIIGLDPEQGKDIFDLRVLQEQKEVLQSSNSIVLGATLALNLGAFEGDKVLVADIDRSRRSYNVVGTFRVGNELIDSVVAYVSISNLQNYLKAEDKISGYHVRLKNPGQASKVATELANISGLNAISWQNLFSLLIEQLRLQKYLMAVVISLIVIVAAMGIANILILTVAEKTEEIAILRALGTSQRRIVALFTLEGIILGGGGTLLGTFLALGLGFYFTLQPFPLPGSLNYITQLPVNFQASDFILVCSFSLVVSIISGTLPAKRASGLKPAEVLR